jgi:hypothetical protein
VNFVLQQSIIESERFADLQQRYDELFQEHEDLLLLLACFLEFYYFVFHNNCFNILYLLQAQEDLEKQQLVSQLEYYQKADSPDFR